jgi:hypothetical protein
MNATTKWYSIDLEPMGFCQFCNRYAELNIEHTCETCDAYQSIDVEIKVFYEDWFSQVAGGE